MRRPAAWFAMILAALPAKAAVDVDALWDYARPAVSEQRFRDALAAAQLEFLAADALHMMALVQPDLAGQLEWNRKVVDHARDASDPRARRWGAAALNNIGVALNEAGRHEEALVALREAQAAYERIGGVGSIRIARWMVAHTLRKLGRIVEALALQAALEAEHAAAGSSDRYVHEELALLYQAQGDTERAARYRALVPPKND